VTSIDRVVIGAGIAGLLAASRALERGEKVAVLEKVSVVGGILQSIECADVAVDAGAESFSTIATHFERLVADTGMLEDLVTPQRAEARLITSAGGRHKIPRGYLGIPASLDDPELIDIVGTEAIAKAKDLDARTPGEVTGLTVAEFVSTRLGEAFVTNLVEPVFAGVHGASTRTLDASATMAPLLEPYLRTGSLIAAVAEVRASHPRPGSAVAGLRGGLFRIIDSLRGQLEKNGVTFYLDTEVSELTYEGTEWTAHTPEALFHSKALTLAVGPDSTKSFLGRFTEQVVPTESVAAIDATVVFAHVVSEQLDAWPLGSGALATSGSGSMAKATTHVNSKWGWVNESLAEHHHILRLSYGRNGRLPREDISEFVEQDIGLLYGIDDFSIRSVQSVTWRSSLNRPTPENARAMELITKTAGTLNIEICGSTTAGNGLLGIAREHYERKMK
jgi:oxygen-dependent protoporphyrinogen oxidase